MFETFGELPLHPLVVHAVVVLGPLTALLLLAYAAVPRWRRGLRWPTLVLSVAAAGAAYAAKESGEWFRDELFADQVPPPVVTHAEAGELAAYVLWGLLAATIVVLALAPVGEDAGSGRGGTAVRTGVAVVLAVVALGAVGWTGFEAGHSGATAVWGGLLG